MPESPLLGRGDQAILHPSEASPITVARYRPAADLRGWIDYVWVVRWSTTTVHRQAVIPQPVVHVAAEDGRMLVYGVGDNEFVRRLEGTGHVVGMAFRPGAFRAILGGPVSRITRSVAAFGDLVGGPDARAHDRRVADRLQTPGRADDDLVATALDWLRAVTPAAGPGMEAEAVADLVGLAERDPTLTRAEQLAAQAGVSLRTLQRQFGEYVGIGPKWVIQRCRLLDVAAMANSGADVDWARVAADLGFSDQAHLTRAFTVVVGTPPARYSREVRDGRKA